MKSSFRPTRPAPFHIRLFIGALLTALVLAPAADLRAASQAALDGPVRYASTAEDSLLMMELRRILTARKPIAQNDFRLVRRLAVTSFPRNAHGVAISLYEPGRQRIRAYSTGLSLPEDLRRAANALALSPLLNEHRMEFTKGTRIQIDFILDKPKAVAADRLYMRATDARRFETGVDGLLASAGDKKYLFLPGDAFVESVSTPAQILRITTQRLKAPEGTAVRYSRFRTASFVNFGDRWLRLYRGMPVVPPVSRKLLERAAARGIDHVLKNQFSDGRFLYYYDPATDSRRDHEHPARDPEKNPYYNELRHAGGALLLLFDYRLSKDPRILPAVRKAIDWLIGTGVDYRLPDGSEAMYFYFNRKSKLGGAGLGLYLITEYERLSGDRSYRPAAAKLTRHLLDSIGPDGEFLYYHIYLDEPVTRADNRRLYSFYYPGEALMGLAGYHKVIADDAEKARLVPKMKLAMKFLLEERPKRYAEHYTALPSDSWLMQAVNEMWDIPELREDAYKDFVFSDADLMTRLMYKPDTALYPDYTGSMYYKYGDPPYPDGARCEGLMGALELAVKTGSKEKEKLYRDHLKMAAWATLHLCNTPESVYSVPNPSMTLGGIRFKNTRQWFRVDTIQHVASFYLKFFPYYE